MRRITLISTLFFIVAFLGPLGFVGLGHEFVHHAENVVDCPNCALSKTGGAGLPGGIVQAFTAEVVEHCPPTTIEWICTPDHPHWCGERSPPISCS